MVLVGLPFFVEIRPGGSSDVRAEVDLFLQFAEVFVAAVGFAEDFGNGWHCGSFETLYRWNGGRLEEGDWRQETGTDACHRKERLRPILGSRGSSQAPPIDFEDRSCRDH